MLTLTMYVWLLIFLLVDCGTEVFHLWLNIPIILIMYYSRMYVLGNYACMLAFKYIQNNSSIYIVSPSLFMCIAHFKDNSKEVTVIKHDVCLD